MKIFEFFQEDNGQLSSIRLFAFMLVLTGCFMLIFALAKSPTLVVDSSVIASALMLIGSGLTGKVVQKKEETKTSD